MAEPRYVITPDTKRKIEFLFEAYRNTTGQGVKQTPWGPAFRQQTPTRKQPTPRRNADQWFPAIITGSTQVGSNFQWEYDFEEAEKTSAGYGGWTTKANGITGTAYNFIEDQNGSTGLFGNGVDSANLEGTIEVQPVPDGQPVQMLIVTMTNGTTEYWFSYESGVDGQCE